MRKRYEGEADRSERRAAVHWSALFASGFHRGFQVDALLHHPLELLDSASSFDVRSCMAYGDFFFLFVESRIRIESFLAKCSRASAYFSCFHNVKVYHGVEAEP